MRFDHIKDFKAIRFEHLADFLFVCLFFFFNFFRSGLADCETIACEQALLFGYLGERRESRENARASGEAARGRGKESLQRSLIKFHLYFAQTKGNTIG